MSKCKNLSNCKFGRLTVLYRCEDYIGKNNRKQVQWLCLCECGNYTKVVANNLLSGNTQSCGCYHIDTARNTIIQTNYKHGDATINDIKRLYHIWIAMKARCNNPTAHAYEQYGGREIKVCPEWNDNYLNFKDWALSHGYNDNLSIDRIDNNKGYEPDNCRWVSPLKQANNKRNNNYLVYQNETKTIAEWARQFNINYKWFYRHIKKGFTIQQILDLKGIN